MNRTVFQEIQLNSTRLKPRLSGCSLPGGAASLSTGVEMQLRRAGTLQKRLNGTLELVTKSSIM